VEVQTVTDGAGDEVLLFDRPGEGIVRLTMNRPHRRNALIGESFTELDRLFRQVRRDPTARVLILTGAGQDFCTGSDLDVNLGVKAEVHMSHRARLVVDVVMGLHDLPQPTIAAVRGRALGAGCNLALGCDLVIAATDAQFAQVFALRGLSPDAGGTWLLPRLVGLHRAKAMALRGHPVSAEEAERWGLVNEVVEGDRLDDTVLTLAAELAAHAPIAMTQTKRMLNRAFDSTFQESLEDEAAAAVINTQTPETKAALASFVGRKKAPAGR
jgi:2-(1,2-epoxy-1,2-dihydrophenyl)acetyl-CoA isomerase